MSNLQRISKILSNYSICSRRKAEQLIRDGKIKVNNEIITNPAFKVDISKDKILIDNIPLKIEQTNFEYYILNKPKGYLTTCSDPFNRKTIFDLLKLNKHFFPVGRLDKDSRGLILITNDGKLCNLITHPKNMIVKKYIVTIDKLLSKSELENIKNGIKYENIFYKVLNINYLHSKDNKYVYEIHLTEGKKREIRYIMKAIGANVIDLFRISIANLTVHGLKEGHYRKLTNHELQTLKKIIGY